MTEKICFCGHLEKHHKGLDETIEERIEKLVRSRILFSINSPDLARPIGYSFAAGPAGKVYKYEDIEAVIMNLRINYSSCQKKVFFKECPCKKFQADNLKYLEKAYERSTR